MADAGQQSLDLCEAEQSALARRYVLTADLDTDEPWSHAGPRSVSPFAPCAASRLAHVFAAARLDERSVLWDLGCGDGRVLLEACARYGGRCVGVEIDEGAVVKARRLATEAGVSDRVAVDTLGPTTVGNPFVMLTITSPENHARLDELHAIQMKLADPRSVSGDEELERLLDEGKTVVLITQGIHATEVGASQMSANLAYELASSDTEKVREILEHVILLQIPSLNPDGLQWVNDWYMDLVGTEYEAAPLPWLYHPYVGHDNNRDWYAFTQ